MARNYIPELEFEDAKILGGTFKNFSGKAGLYNREGDRSFHVRIPEDMVERLRDEGWTIKEKAPRTPEEDTLYYMKIRVRYSHKPEEEYRNPLIYKGIAGGEYRLLPERLIGALDHDEIVRCDLVVKPSHYSMTDGREGVTAYLKEMYVTVPGNRFVGRYNITGDDLPFEEE